MYALNQRPIHACLLSLALIAVGGQSEANVKTVTGELRVAAVINNKPVFKPATWHIKCRNASRSYSATVKRHTAVVDLEPGNCTVKVTMNGKSRTRYISIEKDKKYSLVVSLD